MIVDRYLELGLRIGRHVDGFVDAYYGPADIASRVAAEAVASPQNLASDLPHMMRNFSAAWM